MLMRFCFVLLIPAAWAADKLTAPQLIEMARHHSHGLEEALRSSLGDDKIKKGTAFAGEAANFIFAFESETRPTLFLDDRAAPQMTRAGKTNLWFQTGTLQAGTVHSFYYTVNGARTGGSTDVPAYGPDSYPKPGVPQGTLSEQIVHTSKIFDGMRSNYWIYVPAQYDAHVPAALMVWQDGQGLVQRDGASRTLTVVDNLI